MLKALRTFREQMNALNTNSAIISFLCDRPAFSTPAGRRTAAEHGYAKTALKKRYKAPHALQHCIDMDRANGSNH